MARQFLNNQGAFTREISDSTNAMFSELYAAANLDNYVNINVFSGTGRGNAVVDTAAFQKALASGATVITGDPKATYTINQTLVLNSRQKLIDISFDYTAIPSTASLFTATGTVGASASLTAPANFLDASLTFSNAGALSYQDILFVTSNKVWSDDGNDLVTVGEFAFVRAGGTGDTANLSTLLSNIYDTTANAAVVKFNRDMLAPQLIGIRAFGAGDTKNQRFATFTNVLGGLVQYCEVSDTYHSGVYMDRSYGTKVQDNDFKNILNPALGYASVCVRGCESITYRNNEAREVRTGFTAGGTSGVNRHLNVSGNKIYWPRSAGLNCKNSAQYVTMQQNQIEGENGLTSGLSDGILYRGTHGVINGNIVRGIGRFGIAASMYGEGCETDMTTEISGNTVDSAQQSGVYVLNNSNGKNASGIVVGSNNVSYVNGVTPASVGGVHIAASTGAINGIDITGNTVRNCPHIGIYVSTGVTGVDQGSVTGNTLTAASGSIYSGVYLNGAGVAINNVSVSGNNNISGFKYNARFTNTTNCTQTENKLSSAVTGDVLLATTTGFKGTGNVTVTAAGSTAADATQLDGQNSVIVSTTPTGAGVILGTALNFRVTIYNRGANALLVYPPTGARINNISINGGSSIAAGASASFVGTSATQWYS